MKRLYFLFIAFFLLSSSLSLSAQSLKCEIVEDSVTVISPDSAEIHVILEYDISKDSVETIRVMLGHWWNWEFRYGRGYSRGMDLEKIDTLKYKIPGFSAVSYIYYLDISASIVFDMKDGTKLLSNTDHCLMIKGFNLADEYNIEAYIEEENINQGGIISVVWNHNIPKDSLAYMEISMKNYYDENHPPLYCHYYWPKWDDENHNYGIKNFNSDTLQYRIGSGKDRFITSYLKLVTLSGRELHSKIDSCWVSESVLSLLPVTTKDPIYPSSFELLQNYPNPFNPTTKIMYSLPQAGQVKLTIYNTLGEEVVTVIDSEVEAGTHMVEFDASDFNSGVYFYRINAGDFQATKKMMFIK